MGKFGAKLNALAKKASGYGGKLGIVARAVDAIIPDEEQADVKNTQVSGDTNAGSMSQRSATEGTNESAGASAPAKKSFKEMWSSWGMGVKVGIIALPVLIIVWAMMKGKKSTGRNGYKFKR